MTLGETLPRKVTGQSIKRGLSRPLSDQKNIGATIQMLLSGANRWKIWCTSSKGNNFHLWWMLAVVARKNQLNKCQTGAPQLWVPACEVQGTMRAAEPWKCLQPRYSVISFVFLRERERRKLKRKDTSSIHWRNNSMNSVMAPTSRGWPLYATGCLLWGIFLMPKLPLYICDNSRRTVFPVDTTLVQKGIHQAKTPDNCSLQNPCSTDSWLGAALNGRPL